LARPVNSNQRLKQRDWQSLAKSLSVQIIEQETDEAGLFRRKIHNHRSEPAIVGWVATHSFPETRTLTLLTADTSPAEGSAAKLRLENCTAGAGVADVAAASAIDPECSTAARIGDS